MIFWFTGQPGSGKTTLGKALLEKLDGAFHIDGDDLRGLAHNVDYSEQGRINNIRMAQSIAMFLDNRGQGVVEEHRNRLRHANVTNTALLGIIDVVRQSAQVIAIDMERAV